MRLVVFAWIASFVCVSDVHAGSSNSLLDLSPDGKTLLVANTDNGSVTVIDTKTRQALREIQVGEKPESVAWIGQGPAAIATLYHGSAVVFLDTAKGVVTKKLATTAEPYGVVVDRAGRRAWVTHDYPGLVSEIDVEGQVVARQIKPGVFLRGIALSPDEATLYVTEFFSGILHAVDLKSGNVVDSWKGHSTDNLSRSVLVHPKRAKAYVPHIRSMVHVNHGAGSIFPQLSIVDLKPGDGKRRVSFGMDTFNGLTVVTNPWEAALSPDARSLYVVYAGTNDMNVCKVIDDDYREIEPAGVFRLGNNPRAIRLSPDGSLAYVYNAMDFAVGVYRTPGMALEASIKTCAPPKSPEWVRGKVLFNTANPPLTSRRWIACSSCHPDGTHDGRVWKNPEGLRKTTSLYGMAHTHPLHYSADRDEAQDFEYTLRSPLMQGPGLLVGNIKPKVGFSKIELEEKTSGRSKDLDALAIYCNSFEFPLSPHIVAPGKLTPEAERGKNVFFRKDVNCASCHSGPYFTDSRLQQPFMLHDVGTGHDPHEKMGPEYDTPTLLGLYRTAPYLHHGKARTLQDMLTTHNKDDRHGKTSQLSKTEVDDLTAFLLSLPYEAPPSSTPNTVSYRFIKNK